MSAGIVLPQAVLDALEQLVITEMSWCAASGHGEPDTHPVREIMTREQCRLEILTAAAETAFAAIGPDHFVIFTDDGLTTEHSMACRLSGKMHECIIHDQAMDRFGYPDQRRRGRYRVIISSTSENEPLITGLVRDSATAAP